MTNMLGHLLIKLHNLLSLRMKHLDERLNNFQTIIDEKFPKETPVILLMDNINMYKGKKRHYRLFKNIGPNMWNFTG